MKSRFQYLFFMVAFTFTCCKKEIKPPVVSTLAITEPNKTVAQGGGSVSSDGGGTVRTRGVCWSTNSGPTVNSDHVEAGEGTGDFNVELDNLEAGTKYYARAYATNQVGTTYGEEVSFTTPTLTYLRYKGEMLFVYPEDNSTGVIWGDEAILMGVFNGTDGKPNTSVLTQFQQGTTAAKICADLVAYGRDDWYLPSTDEMKLIYDNRKNFGVFLSSSTYWTSTEKNTSDAWGIYFVGGSPVLNTKGTTNACRCVCR